MGTIYTAHLEARYSERTSTGGWVCLAVFDLGKAYVFGRVSEWKHYGTLSPETREAAQCSDGTVMIIHGRPGIKDACDRSVIEERDEGSMRIDHWNSRLAQYVALAAAAGAVPPPVARARGGHTMLTQRKGLES